MKIVKITKGHVLEELLDIVIDFRNSRSISEVTGDVTKKQYLHCMPKKPGALHQVQKQGTKRQALLPFRPMAEKASHPLCGGGLIRPVMVEYE